MSCFLFCGGDEEPLDFGVPSDRALRKPWRRMTGATAWSILNSAPDYGAGDGVDGSRHWWIWVCSGSTARCISRGGRRLSALTASAFCFPDRKQASALLIWIGRKRWPARVGETTRDIVDGPFSTRVRGHAHMPLASPRTGGKAQGESGYRQGWCGRREPKRSSLGPADCPCAAQGAAPLAFKT